MITKKQVEQLKDLYKQLEKAKETCESFLEGAPEYLMRDLGRIEVRVQRKEQEIGFDNATISKQCSN